MKRRMIRFARRGPQRPLHIGDVAARRERGTMAYGLRFSDERGRVAFLYDPPRRLQFVSIPDHRGSALREPVEVASKAPDSAARPTTSAHEPVPRRVLFVPVSAPRGMGEYARSLALATALVQRLPGMEVHFALNRRAPYAGEVPFPATLLPSSATFHSDEVIALIERFRPQVVVFDNAGRTAQLRAARASGAKIVFVSSRPRQRRRAFRLRWMRLIDEHWIAYPEFIAGSLSSFERLKLRLLGRPRVRFMDVIMPSPDATLRSSLLERFDVRPGAFVLAVPGGGTGHPGAEDAPAAVGEAARRLATRGHPTVLVGVVPDSGGYAASPLLRIAPRLSPAELIELMRAAQIVISNGGDTLLQALACHRPCVAVPIAGDQIHRIRRCAEAGLALEARASADDLERAAVELLASSENQKKLARRVAERNVANEIDAAVDALEALVIGG
jgi:UDP-N-acetylglucosamine:LPS N-acetylglucosamine transferase